MSGEHIARNPRGGRLSPWAAPAADAPGWQITTRSRRLAVAVATTLTGRTVHRHENGEWQARLPQAVLAVVALDADAGALRCRLSARPHLGVFVAGLRALARRDRAQMPPDGVACAGTSYRYAMCE